MQHLIYVYPVRSDLSVSILRLNTVLGVCSPYADVKLFEIYTSFTPKALSKIVANDILIFFYCYSEKIRHGVSYVLSA